MTETRPVYPEIPLDEEFRIQREAVVEIAVKLGMREKDALTALPKKFPEILPAYTTLQINIPLIVPRFRSFSWLQVVEAANLGLSGYLKDKLNKFTDRHNSKAVENLDQPYAAWFHAGNRYTYHESIRGSFDVRKEFHQGLEVAGDHWSGAGLAILRPDIVRSGFFSLIDGQVDSGSVVLIYWWRGRPHFDVRSTIDSKLPARCQVLVRGSTVETWF